MKCKSTLNRDVEAVMGNGPEFIRFNNVEYAIIIRSNFDEKGINFFTPPHYSQQLGYMSHPSGHVIGAHIHNPLRRDVHYTQEVLFIKKGILRVDFYDENESKQGSCTLLAGDVILLSAGGHGFEVLEDVEMIEIKQGPYIGDQDKRRFEPGNT